MIDDKGRCKLKLLDKQKQALKILLDDNSPVSEVLYGGAGGGGKSFLACFWLALMCLRYPHTKYFIARRRQNSIYDSTLPTFYKVIEWMGDRRGMWKYNDRQNVITCLRTGATISLLATEIDSSDPLFSRFGSREYTSGLFEEAQETVEAAYNALASRVGRCYNVELGIKSKILLTCNPSRGWLYRVFYQPWQARTLPPFRAFIPALSQENGFLGQDYLDRLNNLTDPQTKDRILKGLWDYDDSPEYLIPYKIVEEALYIPPEDGPAIIGVDISLNGLKSDKTVCVARVGNHVLPPHIIPPVSGQDAQDKNIDAILAYISGFNDPLVVVDCSGTAAGVAYSLQARGVRVKRFYGASPATKNKEFANLRSQCYYMMREALRLKKVSLQGITDDAFLEELASQKYSQASGRILLEAKDFIRRRLGRSPDIADALSMTFIPMAGENNNKITTFAPIESARKRYQYDTGATANKRGIRA